MQSFFVLVLALAQNEIFAVREAPEFRWTLNHYASARRRLIETMPGGVAIFDVNGDGKPDLFFPNGAGGPGLRKQFPDDCNRLYVNRGHWKFEDVTGQAGLCGSGYDMAAAAGDFDNDGWPDLFVGGVEGGVLWRNRGDGTFERRTLPVDGWVAAAGWFDFDRDGDLDLFVVRYVAWDPEREPDCGGAYCHPRNYRGLTNLLLRNDGGRFVDVSRETGVARHTGKGMGLAFGDADGDGWLDVFVTNDAEPSFLFRNRGGKVFEEIAEQAGVSLTDDGLAVSGMGVDFRDIDGDHRDDIFYTALANEAFPLFLNLGRALFRDATYATRTGRVTRLFSGWGAGIIDFDNDGRKDLFTANGDVQIGAEISGGRPTRQRNLLLRQDAGGKFEAAEIGRPAWHRGAAFADLDGDGRIDIVVARLGERPLLLQNVSPPQSWLQVELKGTRANRQGLGAVVRVEGQMERVTSAFSYASSSPPVTHFGFGTRRGAVTVEIVWPDGHTQTVKDVARNQRLVVAESW